MAGDQSSDVSVSKQGTELTEGDEVTVSISGTLAEIHDDGSGVIDADGVEIPFWPDELCGANVEAGDETGDTAETDREQTEPGVVLSAEDLQQPESATEGRDEMETGTIPTNFTQMAEQLLAHVRDGNETQAQMLAQRLSKRLLDSQADQLEASDALQEAMEELVASAEHLDESAVESLSDPQQSPVTTPTEWVEGGIHLDKIPLRLTRELRELTGLYRITIEPETREGHHWRMRFEDVGAIFSQPSDGRY